MTTEERVEKLERELATAKRRSCVMLVATAMTVAGMFLLGAGNSAVQKLVRAQEFDVVDPTGKTRADLSLVDGQPALRVFDQNDTVRAELGLGGSGIPFLCLYDQNGNVRTTLSMGVSGQPGLELWGQDNSIRAQFRLDRSGQPFLGFSDQSDMLRARLYLGESGQPVLNLCDQNGKVVWGSP